MEIGIKEAKSDLSRLIEAVQGGVDVVITRRGKPLARLVPEAPLPDKNLGRGCLKDIALPAGWDSTAFDDKIAADFENLATVHK